MQDIPNAQWQGEPIKARIVKVVVADDNRFPQYWARRFVGTIREAVEIDRDGVKSYLDNEDGSGLSKVTSGGWPNHGHKHLAVERVL